MTVQEKTLRGFMVTIHVLEEAPEQLLIKYVPRGPQMERKAGGPLQRVPEFIARVWADHEEINLIWESPPSEKLGEELSKDAQRRMRLRIQWLDSLTELVIVVKQWADEMEWATKQIAKKISDAEIGDYKAPVLLLQKELIRIALEPISRSTPGGEAVVDLYLLPGYDDIASLYYYRDKWHLHYMQAGSPLVGNIPEANAKPLTKLNLRKVLDEMMKNAG